jgi:hypothetical protein
VNTPTRPYSSWITAYPEVILQRRIEPIVLGRSTPEVPFEEISSNAVSKDLEENGQIPGSRLLES